MGCSFFENKVEIRSLDNYNFSHVPTQLKESLAQLAIGRKVERERTLFLIIDEPGRNGPVTEGDLVAVQRWSKVSELASFFLLFLLQQGYANGVLRVSPPTHKLRTFYIVKMPSKRSKEYFVNIGRLYEIQISDP